MRTKTALATLLVLTASLLQTPATANAEERAQLQLVLVDESKAPLANATVTIFTLDGNLGRTVKTNDKGVAVVPDLPVGLAEIYARSAGHTSYAEATRLQGGKNAQTVTLRSKKDLTNSDSGASTNAS